MTDDEILARLPTRLHPYLIRTLALRLLRPVKLESPEFEFAMGLMFVVAASPEVCETRWPEITREKAHLADPAFVARCYRVVQHVRANIERRTQLMLKRLAQADVLACWGPEEVNSS